MNRKSVYRVRIENPKLNSNIELYMAGYSKENIQAQVKTYMAMNKMSPDRKVEIFDY